jgi:hypothetical protein
METVAEAAMVTAASRVTRRILFLAISFSFGKRFYYLPLPE